MYTTKIKNSIVAKKFILKLLILVYLNIKDNK